MKHNSPASVLRERGQDLRSRIENWEWPHETAKRDPWPSQVVAWCARVGGSSVGCYIGSTSRAGRCLLSRNESTCNSRSRDALPVKISYGLLRHSWRSPIPTGQRWNLNRCGLHTDRIRQSTNLVTMHDRLLSSPHVLLFRQSMNSFPFPRIAQRKKPVNSALDLNVEATIDCMGSV